MACEAGILPAAAFLVMARGTGRDNSTTAWSADSVARYARVDWRRAKRAINILMTEGLARQTKGGKRPIYELDRPSDECDLIWLPNSLVDGAGDELPPVARLRQAQDVGFMEAFIELYMLHDLPGDGGLPRSLVCFPFERTHICNCGPYRIYGFTESTKEFCSLWGPLEQFDDGDGNDAWTFIDTMARFGLLERINVLAEGTDPESEVLHALDGDEHGLATDTAARGFTSSLPQGFRLKADEHQYVVPVLNHLLDATVVGVYRLRYRPHTSRTGMWYAKHVASCEHYAGLYRGLLW